MVICSRCHRNVPEKDLAFHMATHKSKSRPTITRRTVTAENSRIKIRPMNPSASIEEISRKLFSGLPQKSNPSLAWVNKLFLQILREMGLTIKTLETVIVRATTQAQVTFDESKNVTLEYDDNWLRTLDEEEIRAVLSHEACHVAVLPSTMYLLKRGSPSFVEWQMTFIDLYDEFLAHEEFRRRFGGSKMVEAYANVRVREFHSFDNLLRMAKSGQMDEEEVLFLILNDAIFFPTLGLPGFSQWCGTNRMDNTCNYLNWLIEDFKHIMSLDLSRTNTMDRVVLAAGLWTGVDPRSLLKADKIAFLPSVVKVESFVMGRDSHLAESWQQRRISMTSSQ